MRKVLTLVPFYRWGDWGLKPLRNLHSSFSLEAAGTWIQLCLTPELSLIPSWCCLKASDSLSFPQYTLSHLELLFSPLLSALYLHPPFKALHRLPQPSKVSASCDQPSTHLPPGLILETRVISSQGSLEFMGRWFNTCTGLRTTSGTCVCLLIYLPAVTPNNPSAVPSSSKLVWILHI